MKIYTGVGSRNTPQPVIKIMQQISLHLSKLSWTLRSGGADGADKAFESCAFDKEIYYANQANRKAMTIAAKFHPAWDRCSQFAKKLHERNAFQILGIDLKTPSKFLICWTPDACIDHKSRTIRTGGTGTAISIADHYKVKIFNLANPDHLNRIKESLIK